MEDVQPVMSLCWFHILFDGLFMQLLKYNTRRRGYKIIIMLNST